MSTQKRETGKNYIGLLSEEPDEPRAAEMQPAIDRRMRAYVLGLVTAVFRRRSDAR